MHHARRTTIASIAALCLTGCGGDENTTVATTDTGASETTGEACPEPLPASTATCNTGTVEPGELCLFAESKTPHTFAAPGDRLPRRNLMVGDFNGDGIRDLFVQGQVHAGTLADAGLVYTTAAVAIAGGHDLFDIAVGDLDRDGISDVVSTHKYINPYHDPGKEPDLHELRFWWGNAPLEAHDFLVMDTSLYPFYVEVLDLENDGTDELALSSRTDDVNSCPIRLMIPTPDDIEPFATRAVPSPFAIHGCQFAAGRVDADPLLDLVPSAELFIYTGVALLADEVVSQPSMSRPPIATAQYGLDLDCSGLPAATHHDAEQVHLWLQDPPYEFTEAPSQFTATSIQAHATGDLNHDGDPDLVVCAGSGVDLYLGAAGTTFSEGTKLATDDCTDILLEDLDADGSNDLVYLSTNNDVHVIFNEI